MHLLPAALAYSRTNPRHKGISSLAIVVKTKVTKSLYQVAQTAAILFRSRLASGQFVTRGVDGWKSLVEKPFPRVSLYPAVVLSRPDVAREKMNQSRDGAVARGDSARPVIRAPSSQRLNSTLSAPSSLVL